MKKGIMIFVDLFLVLFVHITAETVNYRQWTNTSSRQLVEMGRRYVETAHRPDSALLCFTIASNRYSPTMKKEEKELCMQALTGRWYVYFFHFFDYSKAFESLNKVEEIGREINREIPRVSLNFGAMYQTFAEQGNEKRFNETAFNYYKKAFELALAQKDTATLDMAAANIIITGKAMGRIGRLRPLMTQYKRFHAKGGGLIFEYNNLLFSGYQDAVLGHYDEAVKNFEKQLSLLGDQPDYFRYNYYAHFNISQVYLLQRRYDKAASVLRHLEKDAMKYDAKDMQLEIYKTLAAVFSQQGNEKDYAAYQSKYLHLKDTLLNFHQVASVSELRFLGEMKKLDEQMVEMAHKKEIQNIVTYIIIGISLLILLFTAVLIRKNKKLKETNRHLYLNHLEKLKTEEELYEATKDKYKKSILKEDDKSVLLATILEIMSTSDEIYKPDFNIGRLAELSDSKNKYVSQVINETYDTNFNIFLNKYRIQEACRRINDVEHYGHLTIETICNEVGYKSRSNFGANFKRITGLTPGEYQKMARKNAKS